MIDKATNNHSNQPKTQTANIASTFAVCQQTHCQQPAYLFWKLQSKVTKLNQRLNKLRFRKKELKDSTL